MRRWMVSCLAAGIAWASAGAAPPPRLQESDRRDRMFPELVVESDGRRGTCDVLTFTADGKHLLAAGDDKVVRVWAYRDGRIDPRSMKVLRWPVWREQRGAIYALAVSPDPEGRRVAVGGLGPYPTSAAVLDRQSGAVLHMVFASDPAQPRGNFGSVRAIAFSPRGDRIAFGSADGSVWLWHPEAARLQRLGRHGRIPNREYNLIRLVRFREEEELLSVAENGEVFRWNLAAKSPKPRKWDILGDVKGTVFDVTLSRDGEWLAASATKGPLVAVRSLEGKQSKDIKLKEGTFAVSLAFDADGGRLAVGVRSRLAERGGFHLESDDRICLYDLSKKGAVPKERLPHSWRVDCLAFHPDGRHLGVAGGDNHEVTLWDINQPKEPVGVLRGVGSGLWGVALSKNGRYLAFQTQREREPKDPNRRGGGPWKVFDLQRRQVRPAPADFTPFLPREEPNGWRVQPDPEDNPYVWYVEHAGMGIRHKLPLNREREAMPRCFTFLPRRQGQPVRLAVGHYWGVSVYDVTEEGVRRLWLGVGHQGEVMAVAASPDGDWLVSASSDQTISAWNVRGGGSELGASFRGKDGRVFVKKVDLFSPAWESGLAENDEVVQLMIGPKVIFRRADAGGPEPAGGSAAACLKALAAPEPGESLNFRIRRAGGDKVIRTLSTARRRPLWRFFPAGGREWVLWVWGHHYYDTSNNGDRYLGWQMNNGADVKKTPSFYRAEQFRQLFHKPAVIEKLLATRDLRLALEESEAGLEPPNFGNFESVTVRVDPPAQRVKDADVQVTLEIEPRTRNPNYAPVRAELWVNDHRLKVWPLGGEPFRRTWTIPRNKLRAGDNDVVLQCYNRVEGRGEGRLEASARVRCDRAVPRRNLRGLVVGINDYSRSKATPSGKPLLRNLRTPFGDVQAIRDAWAGQRRGALYSEVNIDLLPGTDGADHPAVGKKIILEKLRGLAADVGPDDHAFVFLAGHGLLQGPKGKETFVFCCPDFDPLRAGATSIGVRELYEALADIPCRKVVFLDVCHSGEAVQPVRDLTPGGRGPIILAACDSRESSWEPLEAEGGKGRGHSFFAAALLEATGERFGVADRDGDGQLDARELFEYTSGRLPELLQAAGLNVTQTPTCFPAALGRDVLLSRRPRPASK